jgi:Smg protein
MKETVIDVLMYLFENYLDEDIQIPADEDTITVELQQAGFDHSQISKALDWLGGLADMRDNPLRFSPLNANSSRVFTENEVNKLDSECRGFLMFLEQLGVLDQTSRELVIDRIMALDAEDIDLDTLKWVILMVLFNQPGQEAAYAWMEGLVLDEMASVLH